MGRRNAILAAALLFAFGVAGMAQTPVAAPLRFDAASVRPNLSQPGPRNWDETIDPSHLHFQALPLRYLLKLAFGVQYYQLIGADKLAKYRYDITATTAGAVPRATIMLMLQQLLVDRFALRYHRETRPLPCYLLEKGNGEPKLTPLAEGGKPYTNSPWGNGDGSLTLAGHMTLRDLTDEITDWNYAGRPVFDRTGISTVYDLSLRFTPDTGVGVRPKSFQAGQVVYPPLAAAIKEQLGLQLVAQAIPTAVVVVDHIETAPAAN